VDMSLCTVKGCLVIYRGTVVRLLECVKRFNLGAHKAPCSKGTDASVRVARQSVHAAVSAVPSLPYIG
jgi:hypothetical protein